VEESVLTGESLPAEKLPEPFRLARRWLSCRALMGTVVHAGSGTGVAVASGGGAQSGRIALGLGEHPPRNRIPGRAAQVLHDPLSRRLRPFGLLSVRGEP
jgi:magnesium-transporting ATPase (P-type)